MRRTLALAGAAILGAIGLAGPAAADSGAGITFHEDVVVYEIGVDLVNAGAGGDIDGTFIALMNLTAVNIDVSGFQLFGCDATSMFLIVTIPDNTIIGPGEKYLIADDVYAAGGGPARDLPFNAGVDLVRSDGGLLLVDSTGVLLHGVKWGSPAHTTCAALPSAGITPDDRHTMKYDAAFHTWFLATATP